MKLLAIAFALYFLVSLARFSEDWRRVENKDELRGSSIVGFYIGGSLADTSFGVICSGGKFDHVTIGMGSVLDFSDMGAGDRIKARYKRDEEKPSGIYELVSKDGTSIEVGKRSARRLITPNTSKLVIEVPRYAKPDAETIFTFPDFKPVTDACRGLFKD